MEPLGRVRPNVGLRGGIRHRIIADPGSQVDVESSRVNDAVCIHKPLTGQLQTHREDELMVILIQKRFKKKKKKCSLGKKHVLEIISVP